MDIVIIIIFPFINSQPRVTTQNGIVEGTTIRHLDQDIEKFVGIPFAKPPLDKLRFRKPEPPVNWSGIFKADKLPNSCIQGVDYSYGQFSGVQMWNANTNRSEDCLYLNIWKPREITEPLAVMIWIYGGGFYSGTSTLDIYDGSTLAATENIIVVSINYRVGMLGFIALGHENARGNTGLYDQLMAMKWVTENIEQFGGDVKRITIYGESAGAASVSIHMVSKLSRPYFSRAILGSGSATSSWAIAPYEEIKRRSLLIAIKYLNCPGTVKDVDSILECLIKIKDPMLLAKYEFYAVNGISQFPFVPVIDGHFLTEHPSESLAKGEFKRCPLLMGTVKNEGNYFIVYESLRTYDFQNGSNLNSASFYWTMSRLFYYYPIYPFIIPSLILDAINFIYIPWENPEMTQNSAYNSAVDAAVGDAFFICGINIIMEAYAYENISVYYYKFWHRSSSSEWPQWMGVIHADELFYTFGVLLNQTYKYYPEEIELCKRILRYWGNFIRTGDPNRQNNIVSGQLIPHWPVFTHYNKQYIYFKTKYDAESELIGSNPRAFHCAFWNIFLPKTLTSIIIVICRIK